MPDGNRRWAKRKGKPAYFGHRAGAKNAEMIFMNAFARDVSCVTIWGCSVKNLTERPVAEVKSLYAVFEYAFRRFLTRLDVFKKKGIQLEVIGRFEEYFPKRLTNVVHKLTRETAHFGDRRLTLLMGYSGTEEIIGAVRKIVRDGIAGKDVDGAAIKQRLWTRDLPPVDLAIRTGGEPHWSDGAMMWDTADAHLYFTDTFWPDFDLKEFEKALAAYSAAGRRFGR